MWQVLLVSLLVDAKSPLKSTETSKFKFKFKLAYKSNLAPAYLRYVSPLPRDLRLRQRNNMHVQSLSLHVVCEPKLIARYGISTIMARFGYRSTTLSWYGITILLTSLYTLLLLALAAVDYRPNSQFGRDFVASAPIAAWFNVISITCSAFSLIFVVVRNDDIENRDPPQRNLDTSLRTWATFGAQITLLVAYIVIQPLVTMLRARPMNISRQQG